MISVATLICAQYDAPVDDPDVYDDGTWYGTYGLTLSNRMKTSRRGRFGGRSWRGSTLSSSGRSSRSCGCPTGARSISQGRNTCPWCDKPYGDESIHCESLYAHRR